ncbi:unnamed protein product, partial [Closterium sp. NIES-54]
TSPSLVLYELGEYRCPPGCNGHYHHSWGSACVDLHVHTDGASPGHLHSSARVESVHTPYRAFSGRVAASCSCRLLSHQTLLWHHRLGHPSLPRLRGMHSRLLVSGLPRSLPPLPPSPERRIGLVMEVALRCASAQPLAPCLLAGDLAHTAMDGEGWRCVGVPGWGSRAFVRDTSADKLSACAIPCVFLGFVPDAPGWQFYHPTSCRVLPSQDVTFNESVHFYHLFPYRSTPPPPPPLFLAPGPPPVDPLPPQGPGPSGVSHVDPLPGRAPVQVAVSSCAARGAASGDVASGVAGSEGAETGGAEPGGVGTRGAEPGGAEPKGVEPGGAASEGAESGGVEPQGASSSGGSAGASPTRGAGVAAKARGAGGAAATGPRGARTRGTGAAGTSGVEGAGVVGPGAGGAGAARAGVGGIGVGGTGVVDPCAGGAGGTPPLQPASPLPAPSPYTEQSSGLTERREPASRPILPVRTARRAPRSRPPPVPGTHTLALRPSSVSLRVPLPAPPESSLHAVPHHKSDRARAVSPAVSRLLATAVTDPSFESAAASALVAELLDFVAACRLDYSTALVAESASASPPSVEGECALSTYVLEDRQEDFECLAAAVPRFASMLLAPEGDSDAPDIPTQLAYAEVITVDGMWILRVKRPPSSPPAFKARYVARGFSQRQGVDYFQTFSHTPKMTTLWVLLHVAAQRDNELHSLDFSIAFLQGNLHEEIWLRRPPGFSGTFPTGTQWSLRRPVYGLRQAPREWHDTLRNTLAALGFAPSPADPSLFLSTDTSLLPFYVLVYVDDLVFATADTETLTLVKAELQKRHNLVARYSSPASAALSRLMLPYLFPELAAFATVTDLITHLRTSETRYRAALPTEFCAQNPPPMYITLYYLVTRLPDTLCSVRDHFLSLCPTTLTVHLRLLRLVR